jgi:hypothetical protein
MARRLRAALACALVLVVAGTLRFVASAQAPNKELAPFKGTVGVQASENAPFTRVFGRTVVPDDAYAVTQAASLGTLTLPDSSQVAIGERTAVRVGAFNNAAAGPGSTLTLNHGALRFAIVHPAGTRSNYTFQTQTSQIAVRGTIGYLIVGDEGTQLICIDCAPGDVEITIGGRIVTLTSGYTITITGPPGLATFTITPNDNSYNPSVAQFLLLLVHPDLAATGGGSDPTGYYVAGAPQTGGAWWIPVAVGGAITGAIIANNNVPTPTPTPLATPTPNGSPTPTPTPTQVPYGNLMVSTNTLTFTTVGGPAQTFTVQQTGPGGQITIGSPNCDENGAAAMDSPPSVPITPTSGASTISVTAQAAPTSSPPPAVACTILITGGNGQTATVNVDITSTSIGVHGLRPTSPPAPPTSGPPTPPPPPSGRPPH